MSVRGHRKDKRKNIKIVLLVIAGVILLAYAGGVMYFRKHFVLGTSINGVNCMGRSVAGAENKLTDAVQNFELTLAARDNKNAILKGRDFSMDVIFDDSINNLLKEQNAFLWPVSWIGKKDKSIGVTINYDEAALMKLIDGLELVKASNMKPPVSAKLEYNSASKQYETVKEEQGSTILIPVLKSKVKEAVEGLNGILDLEKNKCYKVPDYTEDDKAVQDALNDVNKYVAAEVTYDYKTDKVNVDSDQIALWIDIGEDFTVSFDKDAVQEFVSNMAASHDTIFTNREFKTSYGYKININKGDYGWWTNRVEERKDLIRFIKEGKAGVKEPIYYQKAMKRGKNDIGKTYVEVNLTRQHVHLYKNGKLVDEADCVSGKTKSPTPAGIFSITYKDHTYEGHQVELTGEDYSSEVNFFIPFYGNVGLHDAGWRRSFGGTQYKTRGSHGCVNLPYHMAESIYNTVDKGMPVIVYEEPGVPSATTEAATTESQ